MAGNKQYQRGRRFEYATKENLESKGYSVMRSPGSKSPADLWAVKDGRIYFIQCKLHGAIGVEEWNDFLRFCESAGAIPILASRPKSGRGFAYGLLTGYKDGSRKRQPIEPIEL